MTFRSHDRVASTRCDHCGSSECTRQEMYEAMATYLREHPHDPASGEEDYVVSAYGDAVEMCKMEARLRNRRAL